MVPEQALLSPVGSACISSPFGPRVLPNHPLAGTFHYGVDMPAPEGAPIRATAAGTVIRVQHNGPGGLEILVQHNGFVGIYSHLGMVTPAIADGQRMLTAGEKIGVVGQTGVTYGMHVYFEMLMAGRPAGSCAIPGVVAVQWGDQACVGYARVGREDPADPALRRVELNRGANSTLHSRSCYLPRCVRQPC